MSAVPTGPLDRHGSNHRRRRDLRFSLALQLHQRDIPCRVYERAPEITDLGVGITLLPHGMREFTALGLGDELLETGIENRDSRFLTASVN